MLVAKWWFKNDLKERCAVSKGGGKWYAAVRHNDLVCVEKDETK